MIKLQQPSSSVKSPDKRPRERTNVMIPQYQLSTLNSSSFPMPPSEPSRPQGIYVDVTEDLICVRHLGWHNLVDQLTAELPLLAQIGEAVYFAPGAT